MRRDLTEKELMALRSLVYNATISELADIIFKEHRDEELKLLIELLRNKMEQNKVEEAICPHGYPQTVRCTRCGE